ncbi:MAG TPA: metallophosphoesterase [Xanthobacteraceae bacterium]|jgi:DNA repair exonuclease SbcCD nuclease subunit
MNKDIIVVHSSDLHIDDDYTARIHGGDGTAGLACVLKAAGHLGADVVLLAGDTFESHRVPDRVIDRAASTIAAAGAPVVLLPGNHDPAIAEAVYHHSRLAGLANLYVLGVTHDDAVLFPQLDLQIWGRAHRDFGDMVPFESAPARSTRWQIAMGHGHYQPSVDRNIFPRPSWLIGDEDIAATGADYVALGHWNRAVKVGNGRVPAYYSGSPEYAGTVNIVRLAAVGVVSVARIELDIAREAEPEYVP